MVCSRSATRAGSGLTTRIRSDIDLRLGWNDWCVLSILFAGRAPADVPKVPLRALDWVYGRFAAQLSAGGGTAGGVGVGVGVAGGGTLDGVDIDDPEMVDVSDMAEGMETAGSAISTSERTGGVDVTDGSTGSDPAPPPSPE